MLCFNFAMSKDLLDDWNHPILSPEEMQQLELAVEQESAKEAELADTPDSRDCFKNAILYKAVKPDQNWPLYYFALGTGGLVKAVKLVYNIGPHQIYERTLQPQKILTYRRGRFGTEQIPAKNFDIYEFLQQREGTFTNSRMMINSPEKIIHLEHIPDILVRDAFEEGKNIEDLISKYNLRRTSGIIV